TISPAREAAWDLIGNLLWGNTTQKALGSEYVGTVPDDLLYFLFRMVDGDPAIEKQALLLRGDLAGSKKQLGLGKARGCLLRQGLHRERAGRLRSIDPPQSERCQYTFYPRRRSLSKARVRKSHARPRRSFADQSEKGGCLHLSQQPLENQRGVRQGREGSERGDHMRSIEQVCLLVSSRDLFTATKLEESHRRLDSGASAVFFPRSQADPTLHDSRGVQTPRRRHRWGDCRLHGSRPHRCEEPTWLR